jgi:hypothetical protein
VVVFREVQACFVLKNGLETAPHSLFGIDFVDVSTKLSASSRPTRAGWVALAPSRWATSGC